MGVVNGCAILKAPCIQKAIRDENKPIANVFFRKYLKTQNATEHRIDM